MTKILVVDDNKDLVLSLKIWLILDGHEVRTAQDGIELIMELRDPPELIILDLMMPELDGWEVARILKRSTKFKKIPIMVLTALPPNREISCEAYIQKPVNPEEISREVARLCPSQPQPVVVPQTPQT